MCAVTLVCVCVQKEGCYHAGLELTGRFLSAHGQGLGQAGQPSLHTHKTLQVYTECMYTCTGMVYSPAVLSAQTLHNVYSIVLYMYD